MPGSLISKAATLICRRNMTLFNLECNNVAQQVKRKCCLYYLTLKIMPKLYILIKLKPKELHKPFSFDFFPFKIAIKEKGKISAIPHIFNIVCHNFQCDITQKAYVKIPVNQVSLQCSCKYTSISFVVKPIDEVCLELKSAFSLEGSHRTC